MMRNYLFLIIIIGLTACSSVPVITGAESEAEIAYRQGEAYLKDDDYERAEKSFMHVITEYNYSKYEAFATIGLGDTYYKKEEYPSALEVYKRFITMKPNHALAGYASFQIANCYWEQRPSDFFILPSPENRDLGVVEQAVAHYKVFLSRYPGSEYRDQALKNLGDAEGLLVRRELNVAQFYLKQERCTGVWMRLDYIKQHFEISSEKVKSEIAELEKKCGSRSS